MTVGMRRRPSGGHTAHREQEARIADVAAAEFRRLGVRRTSLDHIAEVAGVSRSTLYRRFPSKSDLLAYVIVRMRRLYVREIGAQFEGMDPRAVVVEAFHLAVIDFGKDELVKQILAEEPAAMDQLIGFEAPHVDLVNEFSSGIVATLRAAGASMPESDLRLAAEAQFRLMASFALTPSRALNINDPDSIRDFAAKFLAPMIW